MCYRALFIYNSIAIIYKSCLYLQRVSEMEYLK